MKIDQMIPRGFFKRRYDVVAGGSPLATLRTHESRSEFVLGGTTYGIQREPGWGDFVISSDEGEIGRATKHSALTSTFTVTFDDTEYTLVSPGLKSSFELRTGEATVGAVRAGGFWAIRGEVDLPDELSTARQLFVLWLVAIMWVRAEETAAVSTV
ncbi:hypothetical protein ABI59_20850 [Acidobacteria bacterium Mor1]|nr:hypothetical protein ABI59_20850 [Acidobacteria bacterium Mor1]